MPDRRADIMREAHRLFRRQLDFDPDYTFGRAIKWAAHNARARRSDIKRQMTEIAAGVRAFEPVFGPYGRNPKEKTS